MSFTSVHIRNSAKRHQSDILFILPKLNSYLEQTSVRNTDFKSTELEFWSMPICLIS